MKHLHGQTYTYISARHLTKREGPGTCAYRRRVPRQPKPTCLPQNLNIVSASVQILFRCQRGYGISYHFVHIRKYDFCLDRYYKRSEWYLAKASVTAFVFYICFEKCRPSQPLTDIIRRLFLLGSERNERPKYYKAYSDASDMFLCQGILEEINGVEILLVIMAQGTTPACLLQKRYQEYWEQTKGDNTTDTPDLENKN